MIDRATLETVVMRANLAPSVHNTQPARWRLMGDTLLIALNPDLVLPVGDPSGHDAALSCGAAVEATLLALGDIGIGATVTDAWTDDDRHTWRGHRLMARLQLGPGQADPLANQLEQRFTWRAAFAQDVPQLFGWSRPDSEMILDQPRRAWLAALNDDVSLDIMQGRPFRRELLSWMRLSQGHPRVAFDGLSHAALQMDRGTARAARLALGPFWGLLNLFGATRSMTAEHDATLSAPLHLCFHRPTDESPVATGRAYLRMWLEATNLGFAGWPMAALTDHPRSQAALRETLGIGPDRKLVQVLRFGKAAGPMPPRARRPLDEVLYD